MTRKHQTTGVAQNIPESPSHLEEANFPVYANQNFRQPQDYYASPRQLVLKAAWRLALSGAVRNAQDVRAVCGFNTKGTLNEKAQTVDTTIIQPRKCYFINIWKKLHSSWKHLFRCMSCNNHILWGERYTEREKKINITSHWLFIKSQYRHFTYKKKAALHPYIPPSPHKLGKRKYPWQARIPQC